MIFVYSTWQRLSSLGRHWGLSENISSNRVSGFRSTAATSFRPRQPSRQSSVNHRLFLDHHWPALLTVILREVSVQFYKKIAGSRTILFVLSWFSLIFLIPGNKKHSWRLSLQHWHRNVVVCACKHNSASKQEFTVTGTNWCVCASSATTQGYRQR